MKKIANSIMLRGIATALCLSFLISLSLRISAAEAAYAVTDLKSASQFKTDATRYENAIRAIGGIAAMKLETSDQLKQAIAILNRERPNLRFHLSKLVVLGINDLTFSNAVKKKVADKQAAEALAKALDADPKAILKLDGASALLARMLQSLQADAATLRRVGERLKEAAEKIKSQARILPRPGGTDEFKLIPANFYETRQPFGEPDPLVMVQEVYRGPTERLVSDGIVFIAVAVVVAAAIGTILVLGTVIKNVIINLFTQDGQDALTECQKKADDALASCLAGAKTAPFPLNLAGETICNSQWLISWAACLIT